MNIGATSCIESRTENFAHSRERDEEEKDPESSSVAGTIYSGRRHNGFSSTIYCQVIDQGLDLESSLVDNSTLVDISGETSDSKSTRTDDELSSITNTIYPEETEVQVLQDDEGVPYGYTEQDLTGTNFWCGLRRHGWREMKGRQLDFNYLYAAPKHQHWDRNMVLLQLRAIEYNDIDVADIFIFTSEKQVAVYVKGVLERREQR